MLKKKNESLSGTLELHNSRQISPNNSLEKRAKISSSKLEFTLQRNPQKPISMFKKDEELYHTNKLENFKERLNKVLYEKQLNESQQLSSHQISHLNFIKDLYNALGLEYEEEGNSEQDISLKEKYILSFLEDKKDFKIQTQENNANVEYMSLSKHPLSGRIQTISDENFHYTFRIENLQLDSEIPLPEQCRVTFTFFNDSIFSENGQHYESFIEWPSLNIDFYFVSNEDQLFPEIHCKIVQEENDERRILIDNIIVKISDFQKGNSLCVISVNEENIKGSLRVYGLLKRLNF